MNIRSNHILTDTSDAEVTYDLDHLIWQIWHELDGQVPRARIRQVAMQVEVAFRDAPVTTHVPLWVRHLTREWLREEITRRNLKGVERVFSQAHPGPPLLIRPSLWSSLVMMDLTQRLSSWGPDAEDITIANQLVDGSRKGTI